jgi:hypothetical protein
VLDKTTNKERERHFVDVFKGLLQDFPDGEIIANEQQERPDAVVVTAQGKIGVEITRIQKEKLKREESEVESAIAEAQRIYERLNLPKLHVSVHVGDGKSFNRSSRKKFAAAISNLVSKNIPTQDGSIELENDWSNPDLFPFEINSIGIYRFAKLTRNHWNRPDGGIFRTEIIDEIQNIISGKNQLLENYDRTCIAHWLLIVAEGFSPSSFFDPSASTLSHPYKTQFDRAFYLDLFSRKLFELKLEAA